MTTTHFRMAAILLAGIMLAACSGGNNTPATPTAAQSVVCDPENPATFDECGTVLVGFTDADGDFLNYTVDVVKLTLETANGRTVEALPRRTRINFTDYVDLSELVTAITVPPATYVSGTITLDYVDAEVFVADGDDSKKAIITDLGGTPLQQADLKIVLSNRDQLTVVKRRTSLLQLDFDLEASHAVDVVPTPAMAATDLLIIAEVHPVDTKDFRVRGPMVDVDADGMNYVVAIRPFHGREGEFGRMRVYVTEQTEIEVDDEPYVGREGLRALLAAGPGTPTLAKGTLAVADRQFTADLVLAGSSVPGTDQDAVVGNVIKRSGNFLTIRGATVIPRDSASDRRAHFHDDVVVEVGPDTKVSRDGHRQADLGIDALSIGQRVTVRGAQATATNDALAPQVRFDATAGAVRMHVTHVSGIVNTIMPGQTDITLHSIDRRRVEVFDFSGTGPSADLDANPANYEIANDNLVFASFATGKPIVAYGFPSAFGMAPPDFNGRTLVDFIDVRSELGLSWGSSGTIAPFARIASDGLVLALDNNAIGARHHVKQGPVLIDLLSLGSNTIVIPHATDRMLFSIKTGDSLRQYSDFPDFVADLTTSLNGATTARALYMRGQFDRGTNTFTAYKIGVFLQEPPM